MEELAGTVAAEKAANTPDRVMESPDYTAWWAAQRWGAGKQQSPIHLRALPPEPSAHLVQHPGHRSQPFRVLPVSIPKAWCFFHLLGPLQEPMVEKGQGGLFADDDLRS